MDTNNFHGNTILAVSGSFNKFFEVIRGKSIDTDNLSFDSEGAIKYIRTYELLANFDKNKDVRYVPEDIIELDHLICKEEDIIGCFDGFLNNGDYGSLGVVKNGLSGVLGAGLCIIKPKNNLYHKFALCLLQSSDFKSQITSFAKGSIVFHAGHALNDVKFTIPTIEQQIKIGDYLEIKITAIDKIIEKKQKLAELLKEKRQALITQATTKGLDPNVKMKDSGVEWLGKVPEHWEVLPVKRVTKVQLSNVDKHTVESEQSIRLCNYVDVYKNDKITNSMDFMVATATTEQVKRLSLKLGDVLITKDSETPDDIGVPALVSDNLEGVVCGYHLALIRPYKDFVVGSYIAWLLSSGYVKVYFETTAVGMTRYGLGKYAIENLLLPAPTVDEQHAIDAFLDREITRIDTLIAKTDQSITLLRERREVLITEVVTGAVNV